MKYAQTLDAPRELIIATNTNLPYGDEFVIEMEARHKARVGLFEERFPGYELTGEDRVLQTMLESMCWGKTFHVDFDEQPDGPIWQAIHAEYTDARDLAATRADALPEPEKPSLKKATFAQRKTALMKKSKMDLFAQARQIDAISDDQQIRRITKNALVLAILNVQGE